MYRFYEHLGLSQLVPDNLTSFESLFRLHYTELCRYALKLTRNEQVAEEVVQEVFVSFWERRNEITITHSVKSYLVSSVRNRSINYLKLQLPKDRKKEDIEEHNMGASVDDTSSGIEYKELYDLIQYAITTLPQKCRAIFILSREEGLTYQQIADQLDLSLKTVENQMGIALKKLRLVLKAHIDRLTIVLIAVYHLFTI